jgi:DNA-binding response OmpR family regulator
MARILLAEPDPSNRELLEAVVRDLGHEALHAWTDGAPPVDAVILEPASPSAMRIARALRLAEPGLPVVCVSSRTATADALALDPSAYLVKPVALEELEAAVTDALSR